MKSHYHNINLTKKKDQISHGIKAVFLPLLLAIAIFILPLKRADAQSVPTLSYNSPQVYLPNTVITPLAPTSSGVATPAYSTTVVTINTGLSSPFGVATDAAGNLYVSDLATKTVKEFPAGGGTPVIIGSGEFSHPEGITVDASGNLYAAGDYNGQVTEILKSNGSAVNSGTGFNEFSDVAVDAAGDIYVADFGNNNSVKEILKSNGSTVPVGSGFGYYCIAVATDAVGNLYVADTHNGIKEVLASNGNTINLGSGISNPQGVAVDAVGNVFVSDQGNGAIKEIPVGSNTPVTLVSGLTNPGQIAVDGAGNVYFVDATAGTVQEIKPVGGYYISALPPGLSFNSSTGVISGTAPANVPPTNYTVTAYNANGSATAVINITVGTPPAPTLSYQSPQIYTSGAAIFPLAPSSTGVSPPAYSATKITVGTGYNDDQAVATDAAGNIYVTDHYNNSVKKIPAGGGSQVTVASNLTGGVDGVAVDASGNLYVSENTTNTVLKIPAGGGSPVAIGSGFNGPGGLAVDAAGNVYLADILNNAVKKILASDGSTVTLATGLGNAYGVAVDATGNVYVAATYSNAVMKIPAGGGSPVSLGAGFNTPESVAVDATGNVYVSDFGSKSIKMIAVGGSTSTIATNFSYPQGLTVDGAGNIYLADAGADVVDQIKPTGGYHLNSALPTGLSFNGSTGVISGTPSAVSPAKDYTVTAYNVAGSAKATVNLSVVAPVTITSITRQYAALTNTFYASYIVVFSGPVTGLKPSNFSVTPTNGITDVSINYVAGSGNTYNVVAFTGLGDGTITLNMDNDLGVQPGISTALPFAGNTYIIDKTLPAITISNPSATSTSSAPVTYTVTYADANFNSSTLTASNITLNTSGNAAAGSVSVSGSGTSYTVTLSSITGTGTLGISIAANTATDNAGNGAAAAGPSATFNVVVPPTPAISNSGTLTALSTTYGTASSTTSFTTSGINLTADIVVTAPAGFEVSTSPSSNFGNTLTLTASGGSVSNTTIYVRLAAATIPGNYTGYVTLSSGANIANVAAVSSTVSQKPLTLTLNNNPAIGKFYDGTPIIGLSPGNYELNGIIAGDVVTIYGPATFDDANAGTGKTITANNFVLSGSAKNNYTLTTTSATTTGSINALPVTVTANAQSKSFGSTDPTLTYSVSPLLITGDSFSGALTRAAGENVGTYAITQGTLTAGNNYSITYAGANLSITQTTAQLSLSDLSQTYDGTAKTATVTTTPNGLTGVSVTYAGSATAPSAVGDYAVVASLTNTNYSAINAIGTLHITPATPAITFNAIPAKIYNDVDFDPGATSTNTETQVTYSSSDPTVATIVSGKIHIVGVGSANITASQAADANHTAATDVIQSLTVNQKALTLTLNSTPGISKFYDGSTAATLSPGNYSLNGVASGDAITVSGTATYDNANTGTGKTITVNNFVLSGSAKNNYTLTSTSATSTGSIIALPVTVTADAQSKTYGSADPSLTYSVSPVLVTGDSFSGALTRAAGENVGTYAITQGTLTAGNNYSITYVGANLSVNKQAITVTADALSKVYGTADPAFTYKITAGALVGSDVLSGLLTRGAGENVGTYAINQGTLSLNNNYTLSYIGASLTITQATLTITANNQTKVYGADNPALTVAYSGFKNGDGPAGFTTQPVISTTATTGSPVATYPITVSGAVIPNYKVVYVNGNLTITKAILTVTADNKSRNYGVANPAFTVTYSGFVNGDGVASLTTQATATTKATTNSAPGNYAITPHGGVAANYGFNYLNGVLTVVPLTIADLNDLSLSPGTLAPVFDTGTFAYSTDVENSVREVEVTATFDPTATVTVNGASTPNGGRSLPINLNVGNNTITVTVTAQDGVTTKTYQITVYRGEPIADITATNILTPNGDGKNDTWVVKDIELYPDNNVTVYDRGGRAVYTKHGYKNDWTGTVNGQPLQEGTYFYVVYLGAHQLKGYITILKSR